MTWRGNLTSSVTSYRKKKQPEPLQQYKEALKSQEMPSLERGSRPGYVMLNCSQAEECFITSGIFSHGSAVTVPCPES